MYSHSPIKSNSVFVANVTILGLRSNAMKHCIYKHKARAQMVIGLDIGHIMCKTGVPEIQDQLQSPECGWV